MDAALQMSSQQNNTSIPEPDSVALSKTTVVTMFFNLKRFKDASNLTRPLEFYVKNGVNTLKLKYPMVIFCDEDSVEFLKKIRDEEVDPKIAPTVYIIKSLTEYDYYIHNWSIIHDNRARSNGYKNPSNRNTVSYFLMGMFKPLALQIAKQRNDFNSTYYAWVDLGCSHMIKQMDEYAPKMLDNPLPKVAVCYIHYRPHEALANMRQFMEFDGPCGIASTAYTVQREYVDKYYNLMFATFNDMLFTGYGHTDETAMTYSHDRHPEIFTIFNGDYSSIFMNYHEPITDLQLISRVFVSNCMHYKRFDLAKEAMIRIQKSLLKKQTLNDFEVSILSSYTRLIETI